MTKFSNKQIAGYLKADRELLGISFNDSYNKATYGITKAEYDAIKRAMHDQYGMFPERTPAGVRKALQSASAGRHATVRKPRVMKISGRWQPVTATGAIMRDALHNADGTGYSTKAGAVEAQRDMLGGSGTGRRHATVKKSPAQLDREIAEVLVKKAPLTLGSTGLWRERAKEVRKQIAEERVAAGRAMDGFKVGDVVQFRWEPGTAGVIRSFESGATGIDGRNTALVATSRGNRKVPTDAIQLVRKEHESRVRRSVEGR